MNNQYPKPGVKAMAKTLPIIHAALLIGQVLFAIVAFSITKTNGFDFKTSDPLLLVVPILAAGSFIAGTFIYKQLLAAAAAKTTLSEKMAAYQSACIVRWALLEGPSLFGIVSYLLSGNLVFLGISGLIILYFIAIRPTRYKIETDLNLDYQEKAGLDGGDTVIKY